MAIEIERKFLVVDDSYKAMSSSSREIMQAYLSDNPDRTVRVRVSGPDGFITVKSRNRGAVRGEWEYAIPAVDAAEMAALCPSAVVKRRWLVPFAGLLWEVDEFMGRHAGLVVAEVELPAAGCPVELPPFVGDEVTGDPRYYNSSLSRL